jgi:hypothetical protein
VRRSFEARVLDPVRFRGEVTGVDKSKDCLELEDSLPLEIAFPLEILSTELGSEDRADDLGVEPSILASSWLLLDLAAE